MRKILLLFSLLTLLAIPRLSAETVNLKVASWPEGFTNSGFMITSAMGAYATNQSGSYFISPNYTNLTSLKVKAKQSASGANLKVEFIQGGATVASKDITLKNTEAEYTIDIPNGCISGDCAIKFSATKSGLFSNRMTYVTEYTYECAEVHANELAAPSISIDGKMLTIEAAEGTAENGKIFYCIKHASGTSTPTAEASDCTEEYTGAVNVMEKGAEWGQNYVFAYMKSNNEDEYTSSVVAPLVFNLVKPKLQKPTIVLAEDKSSFTIENNPDNGKGDVPEGKIYYYVYNANFISDRHDIVMYPDLQVDNCVTLYDGEVKIADLDFQDGDLVVFACVKDENAETSAVAVSDVFKAIASYTLAKPTITDVAGATKITIASNIDASISHLSELKYYNGPIANPADVPTAEWTVSYDNFLTLDKLEQGGYVHAWNRGRGNNVTSSGFATLQYATTLQVADKVAHLGQLVNDREVVVNGIRKQLAEGDTYVVEFVDGVKLYPFHHNGDRQYLYVVDQKGQYELGHAVRINNAPTDKHFTVGHVIIENFKGKTVIDEHGHVTLDWIDGNVKVETNNVDAIVLGNEIYSDYASEQELMNKYINHYINLHMCMKLVKRDSYYSLVDPRTLEENTEQAPRRRAADAAEGEGGIEEGATGFGTGIRVDIDRTGFSTDDMDQYANEQKFVSADGYLTHNGDVTVFALKNIRGDNLTGVDAIEAAEAMEVMVVGRDIVAPEGAEVYAINGARVAGTDLAPGVYVVRMGRKAVKVMVK